MVKIIKKDLIEEVFARTNNVNKIVVKDIIDKLFNVIVEKLNNEDELNIEIRGFAIIKKRKVKSRKVYNFKEKKIIKSKRNYKISIKPAKEIKL
ncbi:MAG: HU family DNA-binding protein [Spirochaetes bacterium]|nr:HU family DNA-binding protein [Spirochaetota bacterium]